MIHISDFYEQKISVFYHGGIPWSSICFVENVALILKTYIMLNKNEMEEIIALNCYWLASKDLKIFTYHKFLEVYKSLLV